MNNFKKSGVAAATAAFVCLGMCVPSSAEDAPTYSQEIQVIELAQTDLLPLPMIESEPLPIQDEKAEWGTVLSPMWFADLLKCKEGMTYFWCPKK